MSADEKLAAVAQAINRARYPADREPRELCDEDQSSQEYARRLARAAIAADQRPPVPDGWQLVPKEPTGEMQACGRDALLPYINRVAKPVPDQWFLANECYRAMLAASPSPPLRTEGSNRE